MKYYAHGFQDLEDSKARLMDLGTGWPNEIETNLRMKYFTNINV